jgi:hypothetical protein
MALTNLTNRGAIGSEVIANSVADLKTRKLKSGHATKTLGYHSKGDGGGATYLCKTTDQATTDGDVIDGYGNHLLDNGNVVILQINGSIHLSQFGEKRDDLTDNTSAIQTAINFAATAGINDIIAESGVSRFTKLYFTYDSVNNTGFPNGARKGWGLKFKGKGRLHSEVVQNLELEILLSPASVFRSTIATGIPVNLIVENTLTVQHGLQFEDVAFVSNNNDWIINGSSTPSSKLLNNVSVHQKHIDGSGVLLEDVWISTWSDVLIAGQDYTGTQTGKGLVVRNRLYAGGGMWAWTNINIRGFKDSGAIGYMEDPGFDVKLLDSIIINVIQARNAANGLQIGGKVRSMVMSGYHTEGCTVTGGRIAAEAGSVLLLGSYWDCALCSDSSLVLGNASGSVGTNLNETTWSEIELRGFNFIDVNNCGIKVDDGTKGVNLVLGAGKLGKVNGAGLVGIDLNGFKNGVKFSNVRYFDLVTKVANKPKEIVKYIDEGNFEAYPDGVIGYQKESINIETLTAQKFLSSGDSSNQIITPDVTNSRVVLPFVSSKRNFVINNADATHNLNIRDETNTTTLKTIAPNETFKCISDGSNWYFI